jgi:antitoxin component of MazEF toxin-antitoxin module
MRLKLQQIGNSVGVILPKEELTRRGLHVGDQIDIDLIDDPFWSELKHFSKEQRRAADKQESLSDDDLNEWENL